jgi:hypothetical protein
MPNPSDTSSSPSAATPTRDSFRAKWLAKRAAAKAAAPDPELGSANAVGRAAGRVGVELVNTLGGHPALYLGLPGQTARLTFTAGDALTVRPGQDRVVLRFRPGALVATPTVRTEGWTQAAATTPTGLVLTLTRTTTAWTGTSLELELGDMQPGPAVGAHAVRVEVEWQLGRALPPVATTVYRSASIPAGKQLPAPRPALGSWWRAEATATAMPLTGTTWKTLFRAEGGTHLCLVRGPSSSFELGAFFQSATPQFNVATTTAPAAGARRIAVEARDRTWSYFVDGVKVGTVQVPSGVTLPTAVEWVGDYNGEQAFGALTDVSVKNLVETFATVCGARSLHLAVMQGASSIVDTFNERLSAKDTELRDHVADAVRTAKEALTTHVGTVKTELTNHVSDRHGELASRLAELSLRTTSAPVRAWVEGSATVAPSFADNTEYANKLALWVVNVSGTSLSEVSLSVDLGSGFDDLAPSPGWRALWGDNGTPTDDPTWRLASWEAGQTLRLKLDNLKLPSTAALGPKKIRVAYYGQPGPADGARLSERLPVTDRRPTLSFDSPLADRGSWTVELSVKLEPHAPTDDFSLATRRGGVAPNIREKRLYYRIEQLGQQSSAVKLYWREIDPPNGPRRGFQGCPSANAGPVRSDRYLQVAIRCSNGKITIFADGRSINTWDAESDDLRAGTWTSFGLHRTRDVRIWSRGLSDREIAAHAAGHRPVGHEPGLLADVPLDDLDNTPRNHAWDGSRRRANPTLVVTPAAPPSSAAAPLQPVAGVVELEVEVSNIVQAAAGHTTLRGDAELVVAAGKTATLTVPTVAAASANVERLTVTDAIKLRSTTIQSTNDTAEATLALDHAKTLAVTGATSVNVSGGLKVTGATTLRSTGGAEATLALDDAKTLAVTGATSVSVGGELTVTGATTLRSTLGVTGIAKFADEARARTLQVAGSAHIKGLVRTSFIDPFTVEGGRVAVANTSTNGPLGVLQNPADALLTGATAVTITLDFHWIQGLVNWACLLCVGNRDLDISIRRPANDVEGTTTLWFGGDAGGDRKFRLPTLQLNVGQRYLLVARLTQTRTHLLAITENGECLSSIGSGAKLFASRPPNHVYVRRSDTNGEDANAVVNAYSVSKGIWDLDPGNAPYSLLAEWGTPLNLLRLGTVLERP